MILVKSVAYSTLSEAKVALIKGQEFNLGLILMIRKSPFLITSLLGTGILKTRFKSGQPLANVPYRQDGGCFFELGQLVQPYQMENGHAA